MTSDDHIPVRPQQPPPTDPVQQQLRLLVKAVDALYYAGHELARSSMHRGPHPAGPSLGRAHEYAHSVAQLGGWADSLLSVGTHVVDGDQEYVVGEPES